MARPRGPRDDGALPADVMPAAPLDPRRLDPDGVFYLVAGVVAQARREAARGVGDAEAWLAPLQASRPPTVRLLDAAAPLSNTPTSRSMRRRRL